MTDKFNKNTKTHVYVCMCLCVFTVNELQVVQKDLIDLLLYPFFAVRSQSVHIVSPIGDGISRGKRYVMYS